MKRIKTEVRTISLFLIKIVDAYRCIIVAVIVILSHERFQAFKAAFVARVVTCGKKLYTFFCREVAASETFLAEFIKRT